MASALPSAVAARCLCCRISGRAKRLRSRNGLDFLLLWFGARYEVLRVFEHGACLVDCGGQLCLSLMPGQILAGALKGRLRVGQRLGSRCCSGVELRTVVVREERQDTQLVS